jgi:hypothetical protein
MVVAILIVASAFTGVTQADTYDSYTPNIALDKNQANLLAINPRITEIKPGLAKADIDKLNVEHDPEAIKAYIQETAQKYDVDWKLVYAIGAYESGNYQSSLAQRNNNFFGRKATSSTWMQFDTAQEGIDNQFEYLKTRYIDQGLDTPEEMNHIYCEGDTWKYKVRSIMNSV